MIMSNVRDSVKWKRPGFNFIQGINRKGYIAVSILLMVVNMSFASAAVAETTVGGTISTDTVWDVAGSPYIVTSNITVQGTDGADSITTLTIDPGVEVRFNQNTKLTVGANSGAPGALVAQGTVESPILFTSNQATPASGDWYGITFHNTSDDATSILEYCTIDYAGYGSLGALYIYSASPRILNCTVDNSKSYGIYGTNSSPQIANSSISNSYTYGLYLSGGASTITGNTFTNSGNYDIYFANPTGGSITDNTLNNGLYLSSLGITDLSGNTINYNDNYPLHLGADDVGMALTANTFNNVGTGAYLDVVGGTVGKDANWSALMPYHILGNITVQGTDGADSLTTLTIDPGAELRFNQYTQLNIGANSGNPGALAAQGTTGSPILFTSNLPTPASGDWYGIRFYNTSDDTTSILEYCTIDYAGYGGNGALYIYSASPRILNCTVDNSKSYGIYGTNSSSQIANSAISNSYTYGLYLSGGAPAITGNTFVNSGNYDIYFSGPAGGSITGNTLGVGLYLSGPGIADLSGNTIAYNTAYPLHLGADDVGMALTANTFNNVGTGAYLDVVGGTVSKDAVWQALMPYHILGTVTVKGTDGADNITSLTITPGTELRFNQSTQLSIGAASGDPGALISQGSVQSPIIFTANQATPTPGKWTGLYFYNTADDATSIVRLSHIEYATNGIYLNNAKPSIQGNTIRYASNSGLYVYGAGSDGSVAECNTITDNNYGIYISTALPLPHFNDLFNNTQYSMYNASAGEVNAEGNWWGSASDPGAGGNNVSGSIDYDPWSSSLNDCSSNYGSNDTTPPALVSINPANGGTLQSITNISFTLQDQESAVNDLVVISSVAVQKIGGAAVSGTTVEANDTFTFTPDTLPLSDGNYQITFTAADVIGNETIYTSSFTIDTLAPDKPVITGGLVASGTIRERPVENIANTVSVLLTGTAENGTTLWINDSQQGTVSSGTWSASVNLSAGDNTFEVWVVDQVGLRSPSAWVDIWLETAPMMKLDYDEAGRLKNVIPLQ